MPTDDPRIKRVLKRYRKGEDFSESSFELKGVPLEQLQEAFALSPEDLLQSPREIDGYAGVCIGNMLQLNFDFSKFDYFLHTYIRNEFEETYRDNPTPGLIPAPESGPPQKIPRPKGTRWISVRPKDGQEQYIAMVEEHSSTT
jgi:hypothetical protein